MIRPCTLSDASRICEIYNHYVRETVVTFEEQTVPESEMAQRIAGVVRSLPWLVSDQNGVITGYACAVPWRERSAYRFSVETTVYVAPGCGGQGTGTALYRELLADLRNRGIHSAIGGIALPNPASIALHEKLGFRKVAHLTEVGWKFGSWVDVGYWELIF